MTNRSSNKCKIAAYNGTERYHGYTTGAGKHVNQMIAGLSRHPNFDVTFWVPKDHAAADQLCVPTDPLFNVKSAILPISRRALLASSVFRNRPWFEDIAEPADWVYSPREQLVLTAKANNAITIHDVYRFEKFSDFKLNANEIFLRAAWKKAVKRSTLVFTVSEFSKNRICELLNIDQRRVCVVGNGVEEHFFKVADLDPGSIAPLGKKKYFLAVGGISAKKGGTNIIRFAKRLDKLAAEALLVVIGPIAEEYRSDVSSARNIIVVDRGLPDEDVARWMRAAVAVVLLSEYEGFGIPALEAMAANVPVVGNRAAALPEVIGGAGLIIDARAEHELDETVGLLSDLHMREELIKRGRARADTYRWEHCVDRLAWFLGQPVGTRAA